MHGRDKLLERIDGEALLTRQTRAAVSSGAPVYVTLPSGASERRATIEVFPVKFVEVDDWEDGMSASIATGVGAIGDDADGVMILPADMPEITGADIGTVIAAFKQAPTGIHRATAVDGTPGHPVVFPDRMFPALMALTGDQGARALLKTVHVRSVALPHQHAITDLDTPEDWTRWRKKTRGGTSRKFTGTCATEPTS